MLARYKVEAAVNNFIVINSVYHLVFCSVFVVHLSYQLMGLMSYIHAYEFLVNR